jgi:hypothetical protein
MPSSEKTFRVFVSSTFTDFRAERRILQETIFLCLKRYYPIKHNDTHNDILAIRLRIV